MKRIILSEGQNDTIFLKELLISKIGFNEEKILFFDQNTQVNLKKLKFVQQHYYERLEEDYRQYEILAKSEAGKPKIIDVTVSQLLHLCNQKHDPIILIDSDWKPITSFKDELTQKMQSRFHHLKLSLKYSSLDKNDEAELWLTELVKDNKIIGKIYIIAFHATLENVTKIKNEDTDEEKTIKAKTYVQNSKIHEIFSKALISPNSIFESK